MPVMILFFYRLFMSGWCLFLKPYLSSRLRQEKETPRSLPERYGHATCPRPQGRLVWFHGASVGEINALKSFLEKLLSEKDCPSILVTTSTISGGKILRTAFKNRVIHQLLPIDHRPFVTRFLNQWQPDIVIWSESDLWPQMLESIKKRGTKSILLNGRLSKKSFQRWHLAPHFMRYLLSSFDHILAQSSVDQTYFQKFSPHPVHYLGNLKFTKRTFAHSQPQRPFPEMGQRPVWAAVSTHEGEEKVILEAHKKLRLSFPDLLLIIAPRHPQRREDVISLLREEQMLFMVRSTTQGNITPMTSVFLLDTLGELDWVYQHATGCFVGYSLAGHQGGHDLMEPALKGSIPLHGPCLMNFLQMEALFHEHGANIRVSSAEDLAQEISSLLRSKTITQKKKKALKTVLISQAETLTNIYDFLRPYIIVNHQDEKFSHLQSAAE